MRFVVFQDLNGFPINKSKMIPQQFIEEVQQKADIVDIISSYIPLKRAGRNFKAPCPFHNEKTPSFFVSPQKQIFHCFGCGEGGGALQFLMLYDKLTFVEAVESLAKRLGIKTPYTKTSPKEKIKSLLFEVTYQASQFFYNNLISQKQAKPAYDYLNERGITREIIDTFKLGFAFGNNTLLGYMRKKGFTLEVLEKASLITAKYNGGYMDLFRDRIMFPVYDVRHRVVGFGARTLKDYSGVPKYINSVENPLYSKRDHLFGLNFSKDEIIKSNSVIVTEGYLDMISPYCLGIKNIVASLGTALTLEQIRLIKRYTNNIILVFDSDKAGQNATLRALDIILENGLNAKIIQMPSGFDLDLTARKKGSEFIQKFLDESVDFFDYKIGILKSTHDIHSIEGKVNIANDILCTVSKLTSEIRKYEYVKRLSGILSVREELLIAELRKFNKKSVVFREKILFQAGSSVPMVEKLIIKFIFTSSRALEIINKRLQKDDFIHPLVQRTFALILEKSASDSDFSYHKFLSLTEDKEVNGFVSQVLMDDYGNLDKNVLKDCIIKLRKNRNKLLKDKVKLQIQEAEKKKDTGKVKELMMRFNKINSEVRNG